MPDFCRRAADGAHNAPLATTQQRVDSLMLEGPDELTHADTSLESTRAMLDGHAGSRHLDEVDAGELVRDDKLDQPPRNGSPSTRQLTTSRVPPHLSDQTLSRYRCRLDVGSGDAIARRAGSQCLVHGGNRRDLPGGEGRDTACVLYGKSKRIITPLWPVVLPSSFLATGASSSCRTSTDRS